MIGLPELLASRSSGLINRQAPKLAAKKWISSVMNQKAGVFGKDLRGHFGCVNAIEFSNYGGKWIASGWILISYCES